MGVYITLCLLVLADMGLRIILEWYRRYELAREIRKEQGLIDHTVILMNSMGKFANDLLFPRPDNSLVAGPDLEPPSTNRLVVAAEEDDESSWEPPSAGFNDYPELGPEEAAWIKHTLMPHEEEEGEDGF